MGSDLYGDVLRAELEAAFGGLEASLDAQARADGRFVSLVLEAFGDAIRFGVVTPRPVRAWCRQLDDRQLSSALQRAGVEAAAWRSPSHGSTDLEPDLAFDLLRRDQTESGMRAIAWLCLDRGVAPVEMNGWRACAEIVRRYDERIAKVLDRATVEAALGPRIRLLASDDWTSRLEEPSATETTDHTALRVAPSRRPSDRAIQQYVTEGINQRHVEEHAARDGEFAGDLTDLIDTFKQMRQDIGITARRWRRAREGGGVGPLAISTDARRFALAASDGADLGRDRRVLGRLPSMAADATIEVDKEVVTFRVFTRTPLVEIGLGDARSTTPASDGATATWEVSTRLRRGPIAIRVTAADGEVFTDEIELTPG